MESAPRNGMAGVNTPVALSTVPSGHCSRVMVPKNHNAKADNATPTGNRSAETMARMVHSAAEVCGREKAIRHCGRVFFQSARKKVVAGFSNRGMVPLMPNQHSADKEVLGFYIPRTLAQRVRKAARLRDLTITAFVEETLTHATRKTELTPEDYRLIARETEAAIRSATAKRIGRARTN